MSELRRGLVRITSSYGRLGLSLVMGIISTRLILGWLGPEPFGLIIFVGSSVGLAMLIDDVLRASMIRELAAAHHADPDGASGRFASALNAGAAIAAVGAVLTALTFLIMAALVPIFDIPKELHTAAYWFILAEGIHSCVMVATAPVYNMYVVTERFVEDNLFTTVRKASYLIVAWFVQTILGVTDPSQGLILYGIISVALNVFILLTATLRMMSHDKRLRPRPRAAQREAVRQFMATFGWNTTMMVAVNGYDRVGQIITNLWFGTVGNAIFGVGYQLAAYVRMVSLGVNFGSDAVAARLASSDPAVVRDAMIQFTRTMTRLHGFSSFPAAAILACLTYPIMHLWVGDRLEHHDDVLRATITAQILLLPVTVRAVTDCWTRILYGAGHIKSYAPLLLTGGLVNPVVAIILLYVLPESARQYAAAISFAGIMTLFHFFLLPIAAARCLQCHYRDLILPITRPALAALLPTPILIWGYDRILDAVHGRPAAALVIVTAIYGLLYMILSLIFVLEPAEKKRFTDLIARRFNRNPAA